MNISNHNFYTTQYRDCARMPVFEYEKGLALSSDTKFELIDKVITHLKSQGILVNFSSYIWDPEATKPWETRSPYRDVPIAELKGNEIVINPQDIDFLSVFLSIGHIYGHLVQRAQPERYVGITRFLEMFKPLSIDQLCREYTVFFAKEYSTDAPDNYIGDYKADFLKYEIEAFQYAWHTFERAGIRIDKNLQHAMRVYLRTDYEELWAWASSTNIKDAASFMARFEHNWNDNDLKNWEDYQVPGPKDITLKVVPDPDGRLTVVRNGYALENIYLS